MGIKKKKINKDEYDEIDKFLKKKYDEIVVPKGMFDTTKLWKRIEEEENKRRKG